ncbi:MAG: glycosyltransferase [Actinobacteria bacterium]|nr:glycosyltransferase [Actinomycetota bacterium]
MPEPDLVVLSHLRWVFVWQRPQHIVSRLAQHRRTWFVEEPAPALHISEPRLCVEEHGDVRRVWLEVPSETVHGFEDPLAGDYGPRLAELVGTSDDRVAWLYTPVALPVARRLAPTTIVYDVMDDLASFKDAPEGLALRQRQLLREASIVFTGGRSLCRGVQEHRTAGVHLFASGVEPDHYERATTLKRRGLRPVAGYVGVIDERLDLGLIADLAEALPDWEIRMVGPVAKIDPASLPRADNIVYAGPEPYQRLPEVMSEFHVALMPFALNAATRSISPTKTLEYLAAGLPVVSTRVPDVVADYGNVVDLQDDGAGFAAACERVRGHDPAARARRAAPLLHRHHWDTIASRMASLVEACQSDASAEETA